MRGYLPLAAGLALSAVGTLLALLGLNACYPGHHEPLLTGGTLLYGGGLLLSGLWNLNSRRE